MVALNIFTAFIAGIASFLAPCTFSTLPMFISYISGVSLTSFHENPKQYQRRILLASLFYAAGFILFFAILGLGLHFLGGIFSKNRDLWRVIGGIIIILLGFYMLFQEKFRIQFLLGEKKIQLARFGDEKSKLVYAGAFIFGFVNAFAWTPCIGPIYGQIITLSLSAAGSWTGTLYSLIYASGLMLPFVLMSLFFGHAKKFIAKFGKYTGQIYKILAIFFIVIGLLMVTNLFNTVIVAAFNNVFHLFGFDETRLPI